MDIYQNATGQWYFDDAQGVRHTYSTQAEAADAAGRMAGMDEVQNQKLQFAQKFVAGVVGMYAMQKQLLIMCDTFAKKGTTLTDSDVAALGFTANDFLAAMQTLQKVLTGVSDADSAILYKIVPLDGQ